MSIGILITSRNNYEFMEKFWAPRVQGVNCKRDFPILNIDEDSSDEEKDHGKKVCHDFAIDYIDREERGMHNNLVTAANHFDSSVKYIVWFQTDCWPLQGNFFRQFNTEVESGVLDNFGVIGFNGIAENIVERDNYDRQIDEMKNGRMPISIVARSPLEPGDQWYSGVESRRIKKAIDPRKFKRPFSVEIVAWFAAAISVDMLKEHIVPDDRFPWFHCWDDICFQFLKKNIHNITLPHLYVDHRPDLKPEGGVPLRAVRNAKKGVETYHPKSGYDPKYWIDAWGFDYDKRETFKKVAKKYKGTLISDFYQHDPQNGPLRVFDLQP